MEKEYVTTKKECQEKIDEAGNVCDRCGRELKPIETVNNSGEPTYWAGCFHGGESGHLTEGTKEKNYKIAKSLVEDGEVYYSHMENPSSRDDDWYEKHWFRSQVAGMCGLVQKVVNRLEDNNE